MDNNSAGSSSMDRGGREDDDGKEGDKMTSGWGDRADIGRSRARQARRAVDDWKENTSPSVSDGAEPIIGDELAGSSISGATSVNHDNERRCDERLADSTERSHG